VIPRLWPGSVVVCIGSGPSLTPADVDACRGRARVIAINDGYRLAPWADVLYACDGRFWDHYQGVPEFQGLKFGMTVRPEKWPDVTRVVDLGIEGFSREAKGLANGGNSGYQAIQLAVHLGAARVILLGYDMQPAPDGREHWFGRHPKPLQGVSSYAIWRNYFKGLKKALDALGIPVVNCSRSTALKVFPCRPLAETLALEVAA
jgi:hypothetical protein